MAMPILLNLRAIQKTSKNKFIFALNSFALDDSGILMEFEHDDSYAHPWGVLVLEVKGAEFSYFKNLPKESIQKISSAMSTYLNSGNGFKESGEPIPVEPAKLLELTEKIVTIVSDGENAVIETAVESQKELSDALSKLPYFANGGPSHVLSPQKIEDLTKLN